MAALNVEKLIIERKNSSRPVCSSPEDIALAPLTRAQSKLSVSQTSSKLSSSSKRQINVMAEPAILAKPLKLFRISISNVHEKVAYEDNVRTIFQRCLYLTSENARPSSVGKHSHDTIEVAFATREDAKDAVEGFQNKINLLQKNWTIAHCKDIPLTEAAFFLSESAFAGLDRVKQARGGGKSGDVTIASIDDRVFLEVVVPLFETAVRVRSHEIVLKSSSGDFVGTVEVEYERRKDAVTAAKLFQDNINFFGKTWLINCDHDDDDDDSFGGDVENADSSGGVDDGGGGGGGDNDGDDGGGGDDDDDDGSTSISGGDDDGDGDDGGGSSSISTDDDDGDGDGDVEDDNSSRSGRGDGDDNDGNSSSISTGDDEGDGDGDGHDTDVDSSVSDSPDVDDDEDDGGKNVKDGKDVYIEG